MKLLRAFAEFFFSEKRNVLIKGRGGTSVKEFWRLNEALESAFIEIKIEIKLIIKVLNFGLFLTYF